MNIVHYSLGFPPLRTGGMTKYCVDLLSEEYKQGNEVFLLWPGKLKDNSDKMNLKIHNNYCNGTSIIHNIELINALPVPLLNGINKIEYFIQHKSIECVKDFFCKNKIEVFHIHTLMGLPIEIIEVCKEMNIKTVFTTHDYFGICPKWGLQREGKVCINDHNCRDCIKCNINALSFRKMKFLQSDIYRKLKNSFFFKVIREKNNRRLYIENTDNYDFLIKDEETKAKEYLKLRNYYKKILEKIDIIHFNSSNTKEVYSKYINLDNKNVVLSITNKSIRNYKKIRHVNNIVKFGYLGPITKHKGYFFLKEVCDELEKEGYKFELHIFANTKDEKPYIKKHNPYKYHELGNVMNYFNVLIVPSQWNETFGFTVLEALSYGIPVIVTENVGAKDLIFNKKNGIISKCDKKEFKENLKYLIENKEMIEKMNENIVKSTEIKLFESHAREIMELYK